MVVDLVQFGAQTLVDLLDDLLLIDLWEVVADCVLQLGQQLLVERVFLDRLISLLFQCSYILAAQLRIAALDVSTVELLEREDGGDQLEEVEFVFGIS